MGTFETTFMVPDLTADQRLLPISSVVPSYQRQKLVAALAIAEKDKKLIAANPLVQDGQKLVPSVTKVFRDVASLTFLRGKVKAFDSALLRITEGLSAKAKSVPVRDTTGCREVRGLAIARCSPSITGAL